MTNTRGGGAALTLDRPVIAEICRLYRVRRLVVFGPALTERFDSARSDVDFVVDFADVDSRFDAYFGLKEALEQRLGRPVDLVSADALLNPYFAASVASNSEERYAA